MFALGNKTYEFYNTTGRFIDATLQKLGAERVSERGEGDDDGECVLDCVLLLADMFGLASRRTLTIGLNKCGPLFVGKASAVKQ